MRELYNQGKQKSPEVERIQSYLADFPYRADGDTYIFEAERPTRLGNLIASYELYPKNIYGIDTIFFWNHLIFLASEESRAEVDEKSSIAESILLSSAAGAGIAIVAFLVLLFNVIRGRCLEHVWLIPAESAKLAFQIALFGIAAFVIFYRLSLPAYREYRDSFRAMVDLSIPEFSKWVSEAPIAPPIKLKENAANVEDYIRTLTPHIKNPRRKNAK